MQPEAKAKVVCPSGRRFRLGRPPSLWRRWVKHATWAVAPRLAVRLSTKVGDTFRCMWPCTEPVVGRATRPSN